MPTPQAENTPASDFNLQKISTQELEKHVSASIGMGSSIAIFGRRGTGKTHICKQRIKEKGYIEVYLNMSVLERTDMAGYPNMLAAQRQKEFIDFILPQFYDPMINGNTPVVALLDEVDKADPSLWAPLLEFVQFHTMNGRVLPNLAMCIMTGNLISEGGSRPSLPLLDRTEKYLVGSDAQQWLEWAGKTGGIHPSVTAFINDHPKELFGAENADDRYADPSPRGWHNASEILRKGEEMKISSEILQEKVTGCVGKSAGMKYKNYYEHYQQLLPMIEAVFKGKDVKSEYVGLPTTKKLVSTMITCARLATMLDASLSDAKKKPDVDEATVNVAKFLSYVDDENVLISVRSQITLQRLLDFGIDDNPAWEPIFDKLNDKMGNKTT